MKAIQKDPARRYQTGNDLLQALKACAKDDVPKPPTRRGAVIGAFIAVLVVLLLLLAVFMVPVPAPTVAIPISAPPVPIPVPPVPYPPVVTSEVHTGNQPEHKDSLSNRHAIKVKTVKDSYQKSVIKPVSLLREAVEPPVNTSEYAFLKVSSIPPGAQVYVNGTLKGMSPVTLRLGLSTYNIKLYRSGYTSLETSVKLDRMAEFPLTKELTPE